MSHFSLPQNGFYLSSQNSFFPSTLMMIQTKKNLPYSGLSLFQKNILQSQLQVKQQQNSLELSINNQQKSLAQHTQPGITPKKKRTGCICKKTKCLKMYCQCFASGKMCTPQCVCYGCNNHQDCQKLIHKAKETIKIKNQFNHDKEFKGCNCKKSMCQKKYCQCFNAGLPCGEICKCQECANNQASCTHKSFKSIKQQSEE